MDLFKGKHHLTPSLYILAGMLLLIISCKKGKAGDSKSPVLSPPHVASIITLPVIDISVHSALSGIKILDKGSADITEMGLCWNTTSVPTTDDNSNIIPLGNDSSQSKLVKLIPNTTYYLRAYATNSAGTAYGNELSFSTLPDTGHIKLGEYFRGGYIFYIDGTGLHGLIAATADQGTLKWGCEGTSISGTGTVIGGGKYNTPKITTVCKTTGIAARVCEDLVHNGYNDWFLPSKDELNKMHENLYLKNIGNFKLSTYWSSSQYNSQFAWKQFFNMNVIQQYYDKDLIAYSVRAARSF